MVSEIEYVVSNLCLNDKQINFFILKFKSLSSDQAKRAVMLSWRTC